MRPAFPVAAVRCATCRFRTKRVVREEDGKYGPCSRCGGRLALSQEQAERRAAKAKADLQRMGLEC
jgi:hypothetical protein